MLLLMLMFKIKLTFILYNMLFCQIGNGTNIILL